MSEEEYKQKYDAQGWVIWPQNNIRTFQGDNDVLDIMTKYRVQLAKDLEVLS